MPQELDDRKIQAQEGAEIRAREPIIVGIAKRHFGGSALLEGNKGMEFDKEDVKKVRDFFVDVAPYVSPRLNPSYWDHILLTSIYARRLAEKVGRNPYDAAVVGYLHDLGTVLAPNRYFRKDLLTDLLASRRMIGINEGCVHEIAPLDRILGISGVPVIKEEDLTLPQIVNQVADNLGKLNEQGKLKSIEEMLATRSGRTYAGDVWPSERKGLEALRQPEKEEWANKLVLEGIHYLTDNFGINFDELREQVEAEFRIDENQEWLLAAKDAQESLDRKVDEALNRESIKTVVFDVGGVLFEDSDANLAKAIAGRCGLDPSRVSQAVANLYPPEIMSGRMSDEDVLQQLQQELGEEFSEKVRTVEDAYSIFNNPGIYRSVEGMQEIIDALSRNPQIEIYILSDSIKFVALPLKRKLRDFFPQIEEDHTLISSEIGRSKRGGDAFSVLLEKLGLPDPQTVLFIDDKEVYSTSAKTGSEIRSMQFRDNPFDGLTVLERLKHELESVGLII